MPTYGCLKVCVEVKINGISKRKIITTLNDVVETKAEDVATGFLKENPHLKCAYFVYQAYAFPVIAK